MELKCKKCQSTNIDMTAKGFSQKTQKDFSGPRCKDCNAWNFELQQNRPKGGQNNQQVVELLEAILHELIPIKNAVTGKAVKEDDPF